MPHLAGSGALISEQKDIRDHEEGALGPNTGTGRAAVSRDLQPVSIVVVGRIGKLPPVDPELKACDLQGRFTKVLLLQFHGHRPVRLTGPRLNAPVERPVSRERSDRGNQSISNWFL